MSVSFIIACVVSFAFGAAGLFILALLISSRRSRRRKRSDKQRQGKKLIERLGVMNLVLILVAIALLIFTITMIDLFKTYAAIPDTLVTCFYATMGGECGILGWIKTTKEKRRQREWDKEDMNNLSPRPPPSEDENLPVG